MKGHLQACFTLGATGVADTYLWTPTQIVQCDQDLVWATNR